MSEVRACASCGSPLSPDTPAGAICGACAEAGGQLGSTLPATAGVETSGALPRVPPLSRAEIAVATVETIGDFAILEKIGQGGMGTVYRARQLSLDRLVALKILPSHLDDDSAFVSRFQREATLAARLSHPNLVQVYASGDADGWRYIAMELIDGKDLRQHVRQNGPLPPAEALRICLGVARGLQCGWQRAQLIHRDVKPGNIYLSQSGQVKLGDLGLAKSLLSHTTGVTQTGIAIGTPHYISPEQARGERGVDFRADIYSLGCTLYELLTGEPPYRSRDPVAVLTMHLTAPAPAIMKALPQCPLPLGRLVNKMLRKGKHERQQSYEELIAGMEQALEQILHPEAGPSQIVAAWKEIGAAEATLLPARGAALEQLAPADEPAQKVGATVRMDAARRGVGKAAWVWSGATALAIVCALIAYAVTSSRPKSTGAAGASKNVAARPGRTGPGFTYPPSEVWLDILSDPKKLALFGAATRVPEGVRIGSGQGLGIRTPGVHAGGFRCRVTHGGVRVQLFARSNGEAGSYMMTLFEGGKLVLNRRASTGANIDGRSASASPAPQPGDVIELELRVIGPSVSGRLNGHTLVRFTDAPQADWNFALSASGPETKPAIITAIEALNLDQSPSLLPESR